MSHTRGMLNGTWPNDTLGCIRWIMTLWMFNSHPVDVCKNNSISMWRKQGFQKIQYKKSFINESNSTELNDCVKKQPNVILYFHQAIFYCIVIQTCKCGQGQLGPLSSQIPPTGPSHRHPWESTETATSAATGHNFNKTSSKLDTELSKIASNYWYVNNIPPKWELISTI